LSIVHLLAWTAMTAVALTVLQSLSNDQGQLDSFELYNRIWFAAIYGVSLGAVILMVIRRCGGAFPNQPGEYYLVATGISSTIHVICFKCYLYLFAPLSGVGLWVFFLGSMLALIPDFWAAWNVTAVHWRRLMWVRFGFNAMQALLIKSQFDAGALNGYWIVVWLEVLVTCSWLIVLLHSDRKQQVHRGWLHGIGGVCWLLSSLHAIAWWLWLYVPG
jgi:hypothetical protein